MNKQALRKLELSRVRLRPIAKRFDGGKHGLELETIDDDWTIEKVTEDGVFIRNTRVHHGTMLGFDHIHHYTSDPQRGKKYGFLSLTVQVSVGGIDLWIEPNVRPISVRPVAGKS